MEPYLSGELRNAFDAWLDATCERVVPPLTFSEVRKGVQALTFLYVERRAEVDLGARALDGRGKRAAFASYYAPLHLLSAAHALDAEARALLADVRHVFDLGCGTGASGTALARVLEEKPAVTGIDRSGWALGEARRTYAAFGVRARTRRGALPRALPERAGEGDLLLAAWCLNELEAEARRETLAGLRSARERGARVLVIEPLAGPATPWWREETGHFVDAGARTYTWKQRLARPAWIARLDKASGLDHQQLGARVLVA